MNENLHEYGQRIAREMGGENYHKQEDGYCYACKNIIQFHTSKTGFTYKANWDLSPHKVFIDDKCKLICSNDREEFGLYMEVYDVKK